MSDTLSLRFIVEYWYYDTICGYKKDPIIDIFAYFITLFGDNSCAIK